MEMFRRLFGQSGDDGDDGSSPIPQTGESAAASEAQAHDEPIPSSTANDTAPPTTPIAQGQAPAEEESPALSMDGITRKLPLEAVIVSRNAHLQFGQSTDVGMVRSNNQDSLLTMYYSGRSSDDKPDFGLFIVADGMGGHLDGERASAIVTRTVAQSVIKNIFMPMIGNTDNTVDRPPLTESLIEAIQTANTDVLSDVPDGGTTVTAVAVIGDLAYFAHVGDSRAYLVTKEGIEQITRDHSLVQRLIELDQLTPEEANDHPQQNVLYRAIGQSDSLEVDALTRRLPPNSHLLLCSDGLWGVVGDDMIYKLIRENPNPQQACDKLVAMANSMGGKDNITAVMLHLPS
jgi:PPM family protein phosphatase